VADLPDCELCGKRAVVMVPRFGILQCHDCGARCCEECLPAGRGTACVSCEEGSDLDDWAPSDLVGDEIGGAS
jgi:hypothetical protein